MSSQLTQKPIIRKSEEIFHRQLSKSYEQQIHDFESGISQTVESPSVIALNSGTSAIHLALHMLGVSKGDLVICSDLTFVASANPILYLGAQPVFVDSEEESWNMHPGLLEEALRESIQAGKRPKAIIVVHLYGIPANMGEIMRIANEFEIPVIEDAAHALGSRYHDRSLGTFGKFGVYSFNNNKIVTGLGGGVLVSRDPEYLPRAKYLATQAKALKTYYHHHEVGFNYRISPLNASMGLANLSGLQQRILNKRHFQSCLQQSLSLHKRLKLNEETEGSFSNRWRTGMVLEEISLEEIDQLRKLLSPLRPQVQRFMKPLHLMPLFKKCRSYDHGTGQKLFDRGLVLSGSMEQLPEFLQILRNHLQQI